jgi:predicted transposase/invertase (TIGR01784 family)
LTQSQNPTERLREVALALDTIENRSAKADLTTASAVFRGLLVKPKLIRTILRSDIMKESAIYQEILQEGEQRGLLKGKREGKLEVAQKLLERGLPISEVISITGLSAEDLKPIASKHQ